MEQFKNAIKQYLDKMAAEDEQFAQSYAKEKKSLDECCQFIIGEASKQREGNTAVLTDDVVCGLAVHYYDEDNITIERVSATVDVAPRNNGATYEPTEEDKENARKEALERLTNEAYNNLHKPSRSAKREADTSTQMSLF